MALTASGMLRPSWAVHPFFSHPGRRDGQGQVKRTWTVSRGDDRYRRGQYTFVYRATPPPRLNVFDSPDGYSTCTRRNRSNTALQSLTLMNDSAFFELAMALEKIIVRDGIDTAFRRCTARLPTERERSILIALDPLTAALNFVELGPKPLPRVIMMKGSTVDNETPFPKPMRDGPWLTRARRSHESARSSGGQCPGRSKSPRTKANAFSSSCKKNVIFLFMGGWPSQWSCSTINLDRLITERNSHDSRELHCRKAVCIHWTVVIG